VEKASRSKKAAAEHRAKERWEMIFIEDINVTYVTEDIIGIRWVVDNACELPDPRYPHLLIFMDIEFDGDDKLLLLELLAIVRMMVGRLASNRCEGHTLAPIQLFSSMGPQHFRVIQAYYDERGLHVYHTKLYDFTFKNIEGLEAISRLSLCAPAGDTITNRQ